jgi:hypothetical protein
VVSFTPRLLYPQGESFCYPLQRRLGGPQSRSGGGGEEKSFQPLPGLEPPVIQPETQINDKKKKECENKEGRKERKKETEKTREKEMLYRNEKHSDPRYYVLTVYKRV